MKDIKIDLETSGNSDEPILEFDDVEDSAKCTSSHLAVIVLLILPVAVFTLEAYLYPWPPQVDVFAECEIPNLISRIDYRLLKSEEQQIQEVSVSLVFDFNLLLFIHFRS